MHVRRFDILLIWKLTVLADVSGICQCIGRVESLGLALVSRRDNLDVSRAADVSNWGLHGGVRTGLDSGEGPGGTPPRSRLGRAS